MVAFNEVQAQLVSLDPRFRYVGINEVRKIARTLEPGEKILECMKGWHKGRSTLLCVTDKKIVCIDVRSMHQVSPEIRYPDITDIQLMQNGVVKSVHIHTIRGIVRFILWRKRHAEALRSVINRHVLYLRQKDAYNNRLVSRRGKSLPAVRAWRSLARRVGSISIIE